MIRNKMERISIFHTPVLLKEAVNGLDVKPEKRYIDATLGGGGHAEEILKRGGIVLGIDVDQDAIDYVRKKVRKDIGTSKEKKDKALDISTSQESNITLVRGNFKDIEKIARESGFEKVWGILFDLGVSSYQLGKKDRGFSFLRDDPLDMRMDKEAELTASDIINRSSREMLYEIFSKYAEEINSGAITEAIIRARALGAIKTTKQLVTVIESVMEKRGKRHPATAVFQALRIVVNNELENLRTGLDGAESLLVSGGRLAVISFHSLEDRIVKLTLKKKNLKNITKKPIWASISEIRQNPRARSGRLRIYEKI